jgi:hypothetical protein
MTINQAQLEARIALLNSYTNNPERTYTQLKDKSIKSNEGNYHWSGAYGGYALHQVCNEHGGIIDIFDKGHTFTKGQLYHAVNIFLLGIKTERDNNAK